MANAKISYATRVMTIAAGGSDEVFRQSEFLAVLSATAGFSLQFDDAPEFEGDAGLTYTPEGGFARTRITNPSGVPITVTLGFGKGTIRDARVTINANQTLPVRDGSPDVLGTGAAIACASGAATLLSAASALRRELVAVNAGGATVYIGGAAGATAGHGLPLAAGQSLTLQTSAAVYCRNDSGGAVNVAVATLAWSV